MRGMSQEIMCRLEEHELFKAAHTVLLYHSLPDEVDTRPTIRRWWRTKRILLPVVTSATELELRIYNGPECMKKGAFGIYEPTGKAFEQFGEIEFAVIPGIAFDASGNRLGRGRGYYDRLLAALKSHGVQTAGVCFDFQRLPAVPADEHDMAVDELI